MAVTEQDNNRRSSESLPPTYFLSLTVANFRCFGKELQTLDLSDGKGKPAQWTVLLGENGVGKTTFLQCLAAMQPVKNELKSTGIPESVFIPSAIEQFSSRFKFLYEKADRANREPHARDENSLFMSSDLAYGQIQDVPYFR